MTMEIIRNLKGGVKLCYEGYMYTKKTSSKVSIIWMCSGKTGFDCKAKLRTTVKLENPRLTREHSHPPDTTAVEVVKYHTKLKEQAQTFLGKPDADASAQEETSVRASRFIMYARHKLAEQERELCNSQGLEEDIVHMPPSSSVLCAQKTFAEPAPAVSQPGNSLGIKTENPEMTPSKFQSTSHRHFAKPLAEVMKLGIAAESGIGSEKIDITPSAFISASQKSSGLADEVMDPQATQSRDIKREILDMTPSSYISTDQNDGAVVQSPVSPRVEFRREMTDMTPSVYISPTTKEATQSETEVIETRGTSREDLRNEKVDMMPSIYILSAQEKAAETIDLSKTLSRTDEEEEEIPLHVSHKGRNGDAGREDRHRADFLTEEASSNSDQFKLWRKMGRASTVFSSASVERCGVGNPPPIVTVNMPNGVIITESESGNNREASIADIILNPVSVDICRDEVKEYLYRKFVRTKRSLEFCCPKSIKGKKSLDHEPKSKGIKRNRNPHPAYQEPVKQKPVFVPLKEAKPCLFRKRGGSKDAFQTGVQCKIVEKATKNVPWAKESGMQNISRSIDMGHFTKTVSKEYRRLICKHTDPSEKLNYEPEPASGKYGRKRRKVFTHKESLRTGKRGNEIQYADAHNDAEVVDEEQVYIDKDWTEECQEDDSEFVRQKEDKHLVVKEHFLVNKEALAQNVVKEEVDPIVEQNVVKDEVDQMMVNKEALEQNLVWKDVGQTVINNKCKDRVVNNEQNVLQVHKWVVNFLPDEGHFVLQEADEDQIMKDVDTIVSHEPLLEQNVVKEEIDQTVVNKPDENKFVERWKDERHSLEQMDGEQSVVQKKDKGQFEDDEQEQNVIREESGNVILAEREVDESNIMKEPEQDVVQREEDCVVVLQEEDWVVVLQEDEQLKRDGEGGDSFDLQRTDKEQLLIKEEEQIVIDDKQTVI